MRNDFESNYLMHHGILGQKWGHKNGPPYPLDAGDHSTSEKKAGYKKSIGGGRNEELYSKRQLKNRKGKNFDKDTEEYKHAKLRQGKNIINKRAGDEYNKSKADERTIKQYLKKYGGEKYDEDKIVGDYQKWQKDLIAKYDQRHKEIEDYKKVFSEWNNAESKWYWNTDKSKTDSFNKKRKELGEKEAEFEAKLKSKGYTDEEINDMREAALAENSSYHIYEEEYHKKRREHGGN